MKHLKKLFFTVFTFLFFTLPSFSQSSSPNGVFLCDYLYNFFSDFDFDIQKQEIVASGQNNIAYNIVMNFNNQESSDTHLIIGLKMQDVYKYNDIVFNLISVLQYKKINSSVLLIYESDFETPKNEYVITAKGCENFIKNLDVDKKYTALLINLEAAKNTILTGAEGLTSPSWLINATYDAYLQEKLSQDLPLYYLSQISKLKLNTNQTFGSFAQENIPIICANFNVETATSQKVSNVLSNFLSFYEKNKDADCDYHSLMFRLGNKKIWFSEYHIIKVLIYVIFISLLFLFFLTYLNSSVKTLAWKDIKKNWYTIPVTIALIITSSFLSKLIYLAVTKKGSTATTAFGLPILMIISSFIAVSIFYLYQVIVHKKKYSERSLDILVVLFTFINQSVFCLIDISLFPLFLLICLLSIVSLLIHRNWFFITLFFILIFIYVPYSTLLYNSSNLVSLKNFFISNNSYIFVITLASLPIYIVYLRILTAFQKKITQNSFYIIVIAGAVFFFLAVFILLNYTTFSKQKALSQNNEISIIEDNNQNYINVHVDDELIFENTYRTIFLSLAQNVKSCSVEVQSKNENPILYSDNHFIQESATSAIFVLPSYPPSHLSFSYGTNPTWQKITIKALVTKNDQEIIYTKSIILGDE